MQEQDRKKKCVVVIGDIMLDEYILGTVERVSPESCSPILLAKRSTLQLGGAANVAYQIHRLGRDVVLVGIIGKDKPSETLLEELSCHSISSQLVFRHDIVTTQKTRFVNDVHQQMFRVDHEEYDSLDDSETNAILSFLEENADYIDCIILSDYNKGVLTKDSCQSIIRLANKLCVPTLVDVKVPDIAKYENATVIKGNLKEFSAFSPAVDNQRFDIENDLRVIKQKANASFVVVTLGKKGIAGIDSNDHFVSHPANLVMVYDVTGAGDIVMAYIGVLLNSMSFDDVLYYANKAAGIKVSRFGNSHVAFCEVFQEEGKVKSIPEITALTKDKVLVFTNGCFDIFHAGHVDLLHYAKTRGDVLVVGMNTDESVKRLKGENRPINNLEMRMKVLSAVNDVDYIVSFDEDTPERIIKELHPDVLIKGGDYTLETIVGADFVLSYGGKVETMPIHYSQSTTKILSCL